MKAEAGKRLIKDVIIAAIALVIGGALFMAALETKDIGVGLVGGFIAAGFPFGWRWMSKVFTAVGFYTIIIKGLLALLLGWVAIFVVFIGDAVSFAKAKA
ncbi:MAG: hypothetical protein IJK02_08590 [Clostridia bacterium]|nr:hypothetical protein [Clostridia bacterium]MBR0508716.1 hypothetical protein [Clostridia bacterium]MBR0536671.1 hypothetical protein [Clostridia bacterium]